MGFVRGMMYVFARRVLYRDVKPGNVLLGPATELSVQDLPAEWRNAFWARISGFDVARQDNAITGGRVTPVGTLQYGAPEVWGGQYGRKADVFSFGLMLYDLLRVDAGVPPHTETGSNVDIANVRAVIVSECPDAEEFVVELIEMCLDRDAEKRPGFRKIWRILRERGFGIFKDAPKGDKRTNLEHVKEYRRIVKGEENRMETDLRKSESAES
jgi:serine/threonine protein kinase